MKTNQTTGDSKLDFRTSNFVQLIAETLVYVNGRIDTELKCQEGAISVIKLMTDRLNELCIPFQIFKKNMGCEHTHTVVLVDNTFYFDHEEFVPIVSAFSKELTSMTKDELDKLFFKLTETQNQDSVFDIGSIPKIKALIAEGLSDVNIGNYQIGSLFIDFPEKVMYSEYTRNAKRKIMMRMKRDILGDIFDRIHNKDKNGDYDND